MTANQMPSTALLLSYTQSTLPWPLEISTSAPSAADIFLQVAGTPDVLCKSIVIWVPVGEDGEDVYSDTPLPTISVDSANWSPGSAQIATADDLFFVTSTNYAVFTLTNQAANYAVTDSFKMTISGNVNSIIGQAVVVLKELSSPAGQTDFEVKTGSFALSKEVPVFYARNFIAASPGTPTIPATEFSNSAAFMLAWESNGSYFEIYQKAVSTPVFQGTDTSCTITGGIATDTSFILVATSGEDTLYESITITVSNPDITPKTIAASGDTSVGGNASVVGNAGVGGTLSVTGNVTMGNAVLGNATMAATNINGALAVVGTTGLQTTTIGTGSANANLSVNGATDTNTLTVSGDTVLNNVTIKGVLTIIDWQISAFGDYLIIKNANGGKVTIKYDTGDLVCGGILDVAGPFGIIAGAKIVTTPF